MLLLPPATRRCGRGRPATTPTCCLGRCRAHRCGRRQSRAPRSDRRRAGRRAHSRCVLITHSHQRSASGVARRSRALAGHASIRPGEPLDGRRTGSPPAIRVLTALVTRPATRQTISAFFDEERRDVYCGDLVRMGGTIVIPASRGGDLRAYLRRCARVRDLGRVVCCPGTARRRDHRRS